MGRAGEKVRDQRGLENEPQQLYEEKRPSPVPTPIIKRVESNETHAYATPFVMTR